MTLIISGYFLASRQKAL